MFYYKSKIHSNNWVSIHIFDMNVYRYEFTDTSQAELSEFVSFAKFGPASRLSNKNQEIWRELLPLNENLLNNLIVEDTSQLYNKSTLEFNNPEFSANEMNNLKIQNLNDFTLVNDLTDAILENLETEKTLTYDILYKLSEDCIEDHLAQIFNKISDRDLKLTSVYNFATTLISVTGNKDLIIQSFCRYLLFKKLSNEKSTLLENLLFELINQFSHIVIIELCKKIYESKTEISKTFLEYLNKLDAKCKNKLLREFFSKYSRIELQHLTMFIVVISKETDVDILIKMIELMVHVADEYSHDKIYGKLLIKVMDFLGCNVIQVEQQLKTIISKHKTTLKNKAKIIFDNYLQNNSFLSQSFR